MDIATVLEASAAVIAVGAMVFSAGRFTESVKANTRATEKLSDVIDTHLTWSAEMAREVADRFHDHDTRITILERRRS